MTTTIKVTSHNYPALIRTTDRYTDGNGAAVEASSEIVVTPEDGEQTLYCTTTRTIEVVDLDYSDPRVPRRDQ